MRREILSLLVVFFSVILVFAAVFILSDMPFFFREKNDTKYNIAAISIRDDVIPFQKMGSRLFTVPYLQNNYDHFAYFTQYGKEDKKDSFVDSLYLFLNRYDSVDIYLLAHANYYFSWLDTFPKKLLSKIRMVYNTGCGNGDQSYIWLSMGVSTYIGHPGVKSQSPVFYFFFMRRLTANNDFRKSVDEANIKTEQFFSTYSFLSDQLRQPGMMEGTKAKLYE